MQETFEKCVKHLVLCVKNVSRIWSCAWKMCQASGPEHEKCVTYLVLCVKNVSRIWSCAWKMCQASGPVREKCVMHLVMCVKNVSSIWSCVHWKVTWETESYSCGHFDINIYEPRSGKIIKLARGSLTHMNHFKRVHIKRQLMEEPI